MPRGAREKSNSGFYHVLLRGIGRQNIFIDEEDNLRFLKTLLRYKQELHFEIHAYCLMGNHVHLLMKDEKEELELIMKKIAGSYAYYFNRKYDRVGHLFQDRFKSETIEDNTYYLTVLRYIHQNPEKAGIASTEEYEWSSYNDYTQKSQIVENEFALEMLGGIDNFIEFLKISDENNCLEVKEKFVITDKKAIEILEEEFGAIKFTDIQKLPIDKRNLILHQLKKRGLSIRHISRLTGINRGIIQKI